MNRLKEERKKMGKNQTQIAKLLNMSQQNYANYENGNSLPNQEVMLEISKIFNKSVSYLFYLEDKREENIKTEMQILSEDEKELLTITKNLTNQEINRLIGFAKSMQYKELSTEEKLSNIIETKN